MGRGYIAKGYIGVGLQTIPLPQDPAGSGLIVLSVEPDSPAAKGGLVIGDILISLDGRATKDPRDVQSFLRGDYIGKTVPASILRGGKRTELKITVAEKGK